MSEENKQLVRRWFEEVWNKGRADAIDEMFDENGIAHGLSDDPANPITGPKNFRPFHTVFREAFPNMVIVVEDMVAEGDKVAARCSIRGQHEGDFLGKSATQSAVEFTGITIVRIDNGKIVEAWNNFDFMKLHQQVGLLQMKHRFPAAVPEIPVTDMKAALDYYQAKLGFDLDWGGADGGIAGISKGDCRLFLTDRDFRQHHANVPPVLIWLNVNSKEEVDELRQIWNAGGATIISSPESKPWKLHEFTTCDLDGNLFRVFYDFSRDS